MGIRVPCPRGRRRANTNRKAPGGPGAMGVTMPAIITHHLFGERACRALPEGLVSGEEELLAFLLGTQGPDPLFFRFRAAPRQLAAAHELGSRMHDGRVRRAFEALRDGVGRLPEADARLGRAFALGLLSHYALDRAAHPYVYAEQDALIEANPELAGAGSEVHAVIESDLDVWLLWRERASTVLECPPARELARTERIVRVAGVLMSHVALAAFGIELGAGAYGGAVADMELVYRLIEPAGSGRARTIGGLERLAREHSLLEALAHPVRRDDGCAAANLEHRAWRDPFTGTTSHDSFDERLDLALGEWGQLAEAFVRGGDGLARAVAGRNYSGDRDAG